MRDMGTPAFGSPPWFGIHRPLKTALNDMFPPHKVKFQQRCSATHTWSAWDLYRSRRPQRQLTWLFLVTKKPRLP